MGVGCVRRLGLQTLLGLLTQLVCGSQQDPSAEIRTIALESRSGTAGKNRQEMKQEDTKSITQHASTTYQTYQRDTMHTAWQTNVSTRNTARSCGTPPRPIVAVPMLGKLSTSWLSTICQNTTLRKRYHVMLQCTSDIEPNHAQCLTSLHVSLHLLKHCNEKEIRRDASLQFCTMCMWTFQ